MFVVGGVYGCKALNHQSWISAVSAALWEVSVCVSVYASLYSAGPGVGGYPSLQSDASLLWTGKLITDA